MGGHVSRVHAYRRPVSVSHANNTLPRSITHRGSGCEPSTGRRLLCGGAWLIDHVITRPVLFLSRLCLALLRGCVCTCTYCSVYIHTHTYVSAYVMRIRCLSLTYTHPPYPNNRSVATGPHWRTDNSPRTTQASGPSCRSVMFLMSSLHACMYDRG